MSQQASDMEEHVSNLESREFLQSTSLKSAVRELAKFNSDSVRVQVITWSEEA
jgi:hypothetical protein